MGSGFMYFAKVDYVSGIYVSLGFPVWVVYFNALAKIFGGIVILINAPTFLKEWAFAGYMYIIILALISHTVVSDGQHGGAVVALILWTLSYWQYKKKFC